MRITRCDDQLLVALESREASLLMDACALLVLAADSVPSAPLPGEMAVVLADLFEGLRAGSADGGAPPDRGRPGNPLDHPPRRLQGR